MALFPMFAKLVVVVVPMSILKADSLLQATLYLALHAWYEVVRNVIIYFRGERSYK